MIIQRNCSIMEVFWILSLLFIEKTAASLYKFQTVCAGEEVGISCPYPMGTWSKVVKKNGSTRTQTQITTLAGDNTIVSRDFADKDAVRITQDNELFISDFRKSRNGIYICKHDLGRIRYNLVAVQCMMEVCEGATAIIECGILRHFKCKELQWKLGKTILITADSQLKTKRLNEQYKNMTLHPNISGAIVVPPTYMTRHRKHAQFTCQLHGNDGVTPRRSTVTLITKKCVGKVSAQEKEKVELACPYHNMLQNNPSATKLSWTNNSKQIKDDDRIVRDDGKIIIDPVTQSDSGQYSCAVLRSDGIVLAKYSVTLEVTPQPGQTNNTAEGQRDSGSWQVERTWYLVCIMLILAVSMQ